MPEERIRGEIDTELMELRNKFHNDYLRLLRSKIERSGLTLVDIIFNPDRDPDRDPDGDPDRVPESHPNIFTASCSVCITNCSVCVTACNGSCIVST